MSSRKQLDQERAKLDAAKAKFREQQKEFEIEKRKLETEKKAFKSEKNRFAKEKKTLQNKNDKMTKNMRKQLMSPQAASAGSESGGFGFGSSPRSSPRGAGDKFQKKYEIETKKTRELRSQVGDLEAKIKALSRKLKYGAKGGGNDKDLERKLRNLQKELRVQKRKLRLALLDMEKSASFYRKEVERFKSRQTKWINEQELKIKQKKVIKYVFADDITKIQLRKAGRGGGIKIWTKDGDEAVFTEVDVVLPENYVEKGDNPDDYSDLLKEVKEDDTLDNEDDDLKYEESDHEDDDGDLGGSMKQLAEPLMQELERRMQDIKSIEQLIFQAKYMAKNEIQSGDTIKTAIQTLLGSVKERHDKLRETVGKQEDAKKEEKDSVENGDKTNGDNENGDNENGDNENEDEELTPEQEMLESLMTNNDDWREMIGDFPFQFVSLLSFELDDRIDDLDNILHILSNAPEKKYESVPDLMKTVEKRHKNVWRPWKDVTLENNEDAVNTVNDNNDRWRQCLQGSDKVEAEAKEARDKQMQEDMREPTPPPQEKKIEYWIFRDKERNKYIQSVYMNDLISESESKENEGGSIIAHIGKFLNRVIPVSDDVINDYQNVEELYLPIDTVRGEKDVSQFNELNDFTYESQIISSCFDGVLMAILINMVEPDYIDLRAIHIPKAGDEKDNTGDIVPLSDSDVRENIATVISSMKALDMGLPAWNVEDYFDKKLTATMIVTMIITLFRSMMDSQVNVKMRPELIRLAQTEEEKENASDISSSEWLRRWLIYMKNPVIKRHNRNKSGASSGSLALTINLGDSLTPTPDGKVGAMYGQSLTPTPENDSTNVAQNDGGGSGTMGGLARRKLTLGSVSSNTSVMSDGGTVEDKVASGESVIKYCLPKRNWHDDLLLICSKYDESFNPMDVKNESANIYEQCKKIIKSIKSSIKVRTVITADDIATLNPLLQEMLIADILDKNSNIEKISAQEKKRMTKIIKPKSKDDSSMIAWVNAIGGKGMHISNLERDLSDGLVLLKLLNYAKAGCVDWKLVRKKVRHRFDKLGNCQLAVDVATKNFPFSLVGIAGNDIVEGNQKYIRTLLWQIMRYHALKQLSELSYGGQNVTDADMLKWANDHVKSFQEKNENIVDSSLFAKADLQSWKDKSLSNSIFYLNLIASINSSWVDWTLVYPIPFDKSGQSDTYSRERTANARYTMTIVRRLGGELFMMNEDLCRVESRAVLSLVASIMTIEAKEKRKAVANDDGKSVAKEDIPDDLDTVVDTGEEPE